MPYALQVHHQQFIMFKVRYFAPYSQQWRVQCFDTLQRAQEIVWFYRSCGSPAELLTD